MNNTVILLSKLLVRHTKLFCLNHLICLSFSEYGVETLHGPAYGPSSHSAAASSAPSSSSAFRHVVPSRQIVERQPRMLDFRVEYRDRNVDVVLEDSSSVGKDL